MKREFTINIILLLLINFLIKPVYIFGIDARVQNLVGTESYGTYFAYFNFVFLFQFINDPGLQTWNAQYVPQNRKNIDFHFSNLLHTKFLLATVFLLVSILAAVIAGYKDLTMVCALAINMVLSSIFMLIRTTLSGLGNYRLDSWLSALDKTLMIVIIGYFAWISSYQLDFDIMTLVYGQTAAYALANIIGCIFLLSKIDCNLRLFNKAYIYKIFKSAAPYVLSILFMTSYNKLDGVMLGQMIEDNNYQAGVYASAYRFYDAANMVGYLFAALLLPMFGANIYNKPILEELKQLGLRYVFISGILILCVIYFYGDAILSLLYDDYEPSFYTTLLILMMSYLAVAIAYIFGTLLVAAGKIRNLNIVFGIGLFINIILNYILIPKYLAIGASMATLITQVLVMGGQIYLVQKELQIKNKSEEYLKPLFFASVSVIVFFVVSKLFLFHWFYNLVFSVLFCLLLSFILKIIDKQEIINLLKKDAL